MPYEPPERPEGMSYPLWVVVNLTCPAALFREKRSFESADSAREYVMANTVAVLERIEEAELERICQRYKLSVPKVGIENLAACESLLEACNKDYHAKLEVRRQFGNWLYFSSKSIAGRAVLKPEHLMALKKTVVFGQMTRGDLNTLQAATGEISMVFWARLTSAEQEARKLANQHHRRPRVDHNKRADDKHRRQDESAAA